MSDWDNFDKMFNNHQKVVKRGFIAAALLWLLSVLVSLAISVGLVVLIVVLILHFA